MRPKRGFSKYKKIQCKVSIYEWNRVKELEKKGVSVRDIIRAICDKCNGMKIVVFNKVDGSPIEIPSDIFSKRK